MKWTPQIVVLCGPAIRESKKIHGLPDATVFVNANHI